MDQKPERRRYPRHTVLFDAKYTVESKTFNNAVKNVSVGGICIRTQQAIGRGQRIRLRFPVLAFDKRPSVTGTVVRTHDKGIAVMFDHPIEDRFPPPK